MAITTVQLPPTDDAAQIDRERANVALAATYQLDAMLDMLKHTDGEEGYDFMVRASLPRLKALSGVIMSVLGDDSGREISDMRATVHWPMAKQLGQPPKGAKIEFDSGYFDTVTLRLSEIQTLANCIANSSEEDVDAQPSGAILLSGLSHMILRLSHEAHGAADKAWEQHEHARKVANGEASHG